MQTRCSNSEGAVVSSRLLEGSTELTYETSSLTAGAVIIYLLSNRHCIGAVLLHVQANETHASGQKKCDKFCKTPSQGITCSRDVLQLAITLRAIMQCLP